MRTISIIVLFAVMGLARAEDWNVLGRTLHNVTVTRVEADRVHVTYDGGIGTVNIADMPPELQKRFTSDPASAKAAADAREAARLAAVQALPPPTPVPVVVEVAPPVPAKVPAPVVASAPIADDAFGKVTVEDPRDAHSKRDSRYSVGANDH